MAETFMYRLIGSLQKQSSSDGSTPSEDTSSYVAPPIEFYTTYKNDELSNKKELPVNITTAGEWEVQIKETGYLRFTNLGGETEITVEVFACGGGGGGSTGGRMNGNNDYVYGGSGGGGGYCDETTMSVRKDAIFQIIVGDGGPGGKNEGDIGEDGEPSEVRTRDEAGNFSNIIISAGGGKGGKKPSAANYTKQKDIKSEKIGGDGGSGGGAGGLNNRWGGKGGSYGEDGESSKFNSNKNTLQGGEGDHLAAYKIPFRKTIGIVYGAGGGGAPGCHDRNPDADGDKVGGVSIAGGTSGGGNSGKQPQYASTWQKNKDYYGTTFTVKNDAVEPQLIEGKRYYKRDDAKDHINWANGYGDGQDGKDNTGGGGGGGVYRPLVKGGSNDSPNTPVASADGTKVIGAKNPIVGIPARCYRGGKGGSGIVILHGITDKKMFDYINNAG